MLLLWVQEGASIAGMRFSSPPPDVNSRLLNVSCMTQDRRGFLWFGSQDGLWRFDGHNLQGHRHDNERPRSLPDNWVKGIAEDREGNLWVATREGVLSRRNERTGDFDQYPLDPPGVRIESMVLDRQGAIWLGCEKGLACFDPKVKRFQWFQHQPAPAGEPTNIVLSLFEDSQGRLWAGYGGGGVCLVKTGLGCVEHIDLPIIDDRFPDRQVWCATEREGKIWFGTSHGIYIFDPTTREATALVPERYAGDQRGRVLITRLSSDRDGRIWIGTRLYGICVYEQGRFSYPAAANHAPGGLPHPYVRSIYQDRGGIVWIGTLSGGISKFDPNKPLFQIMRQNPDGSGLCGDFVKVIHRDPNGDLWIGSNDGATQCDPDGNPFRCFSYDPKRDDSLSSNHVRFMVNDREGRLWVGTFGHGLNLHLGDNRFKRVSVDWPEPYLWMDSGYLDSHQTLWIGSVGGLIEYNVENHQMARVEIGIKPTGRTRIRAIKPDGHGGLFIATHDGLVTFEPTTHRVAIYQSSKGNQSTISSNTVRAVFVDRSQRVWVGTSGGLNLFEEGAFRRFGEKQGIANEVIYGILGEHESARLWVSTNAGLSRFDPETGEFLNFFADDGLQGSEFNSGAAYLSDQGTMYFGGTNGITYFNPSLFELKHQEPQVAINDLKVLGESRPGWSSSENLVLSPRENFFSFEFSVLDFSKSSRNIYQYRMDGVDSDWNQPTERRYVNYTGLKPGNYKFRVRGANSQGVWSESEASVNLIIRPHFYQTGWFIALMVLLVTTLIWGRLHALSRQKSDLELMVSQRTLSLRESNSELEQANAKLKDAQDQLVRQAHAAGMAEVAIEVVHNLGNVLNGVGITAETLASSLTKSHVDGVRKACQLLVDHRNDVVGFLTQDERGKKLIPYLERLTDKLLQEKDFVRENLEQMIKAIDMMRETIQMQQDYANRDLAFREWVDLEIIINDMVLMQRSKLEQNRINVETHLEPVPEIWVQRFSLAHVIANILVNAIDALIANKAEDRLIRISLATTKDQQVEIRVTDNGVGFEAEHRDRLFQYGFTSKPRGRGIGLHSCANAMSELGGQIEAHSDGLGKGATFSLKFRSQGSEPDNGPPRQRASRTTSKARAT